MRRSVQDMLRHPGRALIAAMCLYEAFALLTDDDAKVPTITCIQSHHPWLGAAITTTLAGHFARADRHEELT